MFRLLLSVQNPWSNETVKYIRKNHGDTGIAHKFLEVELFRDGINLIGLDVDLRFSGFDHAGPRAELSLFGYTLAIRIYDRRHWDFDNTRWREYEENEAM